MIRYMLKNNSLSEVSKQAYNTMFTEFKIKPKSIINKDIFIKKKNNKLKKKY